MKKIFLLAIPITLAIVVAYYSYNFDKNQQGKITPQMLMQNGSPLIGSQNAPLTVVEWGDYQCTYCHLFHESSKDLLLREYVDSGKIKFVFRDFLLNGPDSILAAEASYSAGDQNKYWEYHDELYKNWGGERTGWVTRQSLDRFAKTVGIDPLSFNKCLDDNKCRQKVLQNEKFANQIGISATPSFLIFDNQKIIKIEGNQPLSVFRQAINSF